jgi:hypothetical protein
MVMHLTYILKAFSSNLGQALTLLTNFFVVVLFCFLSHARQITGWILQLGHD